MTRYRFTRNRNKKDCAVVALINACKWAGLPISYRQHYHYLQEVFKIEENQGVRRFLFDSIIREKKYPFTLYKTIRAINITKIRQHLHIDSIIIFGYDVGHTTHVGLILEANDTHFTLVNFFDKKIIKYSVKKFRKLLNKYSIGYIIRRKT